VTNRRQANKSRFRHRNVVTSDDGDIAGDVEAEAVGLTRGRRPAPGLCWYYTDPSYRNGFWDACQ
jgi:hypothetical protein